MSLVSFTGKMDIRNVRSFFLPVFLPWAQSSYLGFKDYKVFLKDVYEFGRRQNHPQIPQQPQRPNGSPAMFKNSSLFQQCNYSYSFNFKSQINYASKSRIFSQLITDFFTSPADSLYCTLRGLQEIYLLVCY